MLKKISYLSIFLVIALTLIFVNLGKFFDITKPPKKADVIVCLGGGGLERIQKSFELYLDGYSKSGNIILTGVGQNPTKDYRTIYLMKNDVPKEKIIFLKKTSNTMNEVLALKSYLLKNNMKNVIFVSDPPHSRRIMFLAYVIAKYQENALSCSVVGSEVPWWNREYFYYNKQAAHFVISEALKLPSNYIAYGILKPLGLYDMVKEEAGGILRYLKYKIQQILG